MQTKEVPRVEAHSNRLGVLSAPPDASITNPARSGQNSLLSGKWPACGSNVHRWGTGGFVLVNAAHVSWSIRRRMLTVCRHVGLWSGRGPNRCFINKIRPGRQMADDRPPKPVQ